MTGRGAGLAAASAEGGIVAGSVLQNDAFTQAASLGNGAVPPDPIVASDERDSSMVAWRRADGTLAARHKPAAKPFEPETSLASAGLGTVGAGEYAAAGDRLGDFAVAMIQSSAAGRTLSGAVYDRPPGKPAGSTSSNYQRRAKPRLRWRGGAELWGRAQFTGVRRRHRDRDDRAPVPARLAGAGRRGAASLDRRRGGPPRPAGREQGARPADRQHAAAPAVAGQRCAQARQDAADHSPAARTRRARGCATSRSTTATGRARRGGPAARTATGVPGATGWSPRRSTRRATWHGGRCACGSPAEPEPFVRLGWERAPRADPPGRWASAGARRRTPAADGHRQRDAGLVLRRRRAPDARRSRRHARRSCSQAGADLIDVGGESAFGGRPPVPAGGGARARACRSSARSPASSARSSPSTPTSRRSPRRRSRRARRSSTTSRGCATRELADVCAAHGRRRSWSCTRAWRRSGTLLDPAPTTTSWPTCATSSPSGSRVARRRGVAGSS